MTKFEIAQHIADSHNRLANILASGGMKLMDADSVILLGDTIKDLRAVAQQISLDLREDDTNEQTHNESAEDRE